MNTLKLNLFGFFCACLGALLANYLNMPLPWLIGPLLISILIGVLRFKTQCHIAWRKSGQWFIGTGLGLYFTPVMISAILNNGGLLMIGVIWALVLGACYAWIQFKINRLDWSTAWFATCIGGASEMMSLAERHGAQVDKVAASHSLRIVLLVVCVPVFLQFAYSLDLSHLPIKADAKIQIMPILGLMMLSLLGVWSALRLKILNPWILGPILSVGAVTGLGYDLAKLPNVLIYFGQICIGWSLGSQFPFDFFKHNRKFILTCICINLMGLGLSITWARFVAQFFTLDQATLILGLSPGGIAEMALMAKALNLAVPVVIAFQLTRLIFVLISCEYFYNLTKNKLKQ